MVARPQTPILPLQSGLINDYGQTLEAEERGKVWALLQALAERGLSLVYLASWRDPFGDPGRYASEVFQAWGLGEDQALLVFLRTGGRWRVVFHTGASVSLPPEAEELRKRAETEANRIGPGHALVRLLSALLSVLHGSGEERPRFSWPWEGVLAAAGGIAGVFLAWRLLCPLCWRPLRRVPSLSGIIWVCPRCHYTRAGRGRRLGGRRGFYP